ncbi:SlyX family protein [Methylocaldum sp. 14B]|uniref:SlyX family protein n=1 Tax=Methylocaldum sp. 14B TaxID=1912213 RepID=UPI00098AD177|nr:SlyX family protein [Methylocaldum sp. 14B]
MNTSPKGRVPISAWIVLVGTALLSVACGQKPEDPTSPALEAETREKPAQVTQVTPDPAPLPPSPQTDANDSLAQADTAHESPETPVAPSTQAEEHPNAPDTPSVDPYRFDELELKMKTQQNVLDRMQNTLRQQQAHVENLQQQFNQFTERAKTADRPVIKAQRIPPAGRSRRWREPEAPSPPPFSVESVDRWGDEQRVVIRTENGRSELKPGETYGDWTIESAEGQTVTLLHRQGHRRVMDAAWR